MAVETLYRSSRDPEQLFMDKAAADRHDQMLELAEQLSAVLRHAVPDINETQAEEAGVFMARHREQFARAFKRNCDALADLMPSDVD